MDTLKPIGRTLAVTASSLLFAEVLLAAISFFVVLKMTWIDVDDSDFQVLPEMIPSASLSYGIWGLGILGTVIAMTAIMLFDFRERWFWRCMVTAAFLWLIFPPIPTLLGLVTLLLLFRYKESFPRHARVEAT